MFKRTVSADDLARLKREREDADRLYNEALTALDGARQQRREMPHPPPPYDEHQVGPITENWELLSRKPAEGGWRGRVAGLIWSLVKPLFERQQAFNAAVADHVARNLMMHRETARAIASTLAVIDEELEKLVHFEMQAALYVQRMTPYIDTKDREAAGLMRRINEDVAEAADRLDRSVVGLAAGFSGLSDEMQGRWESMAARDRRSEAHLNDVRATLGVVSRASQTLKRELERLLAAAPSLGAAPAAAATSESAPAARAGVAPRPNEMMSRGAAARGGGAPRAMNDARGSASEPRSPQPPVRKLDAYKYVGFEDRFRGSRHEIRERILAYLPYFEGASDVVDIGCGRGEFLDLLREQGISARGVDLNDEMAAICRERGLDATAGDGLSYLLAQPDGSFGGLFAAQVVEHLEPDYLMQLLDAAFHKLRPGSKIVLETINPACWFAFFASYIRDITHVQPLHPETLQYLVVASGFQRVEIRYSAPFPEESKLQPLPLTPLRSAATGAKADELSEVAAVFNENVRKLNELMFTYLDYAVIGERA